MEPRAELSMGVAEELGATRCLVFDFKDGSAGSASIRTKTDLRTLS